MATWATDVRGLNLARHAPTQAEKTARNAKAAWALKLLDDFAAKPQGSAFWLHRRREVAAQLKVRVNDPTKINQADTFLCGVTSVVRAAVDHCQPLPLTSPESKKESSVANWLAIAC